MPAVKKRRILFRIASCPYCQRAELELDRAAVSYEKFDINPQDRSVVELLSGQSTVPVLVEVIGSENQDDDILAYIPEIKKS